MARTFVTFPDTLVWTTTDGPEHLRHVSAASQNVIIKPFKPYPILSVCSFLGLHQYLWSSLSAFHYFDGRMVYFGTQVWERQRVQVFAQCIWILCVAAQIATTFTSPMQ